jgi:hypothetical protein
MRILTMKYKQFGLGLSLCLAATGLFATTTPGSTSSEPPSLTQEEIQKRIEELERLPKSKGAVVEFESLREANGAQTLQCGSHVFEREPTRNYRTFHGFQVMGNCYHIKIRDAGGISDATVSPLRRCPGEIAVFRHTSFPLEHGSTKVASTVFKECIDSFDPDPTKYEVLSTHGLDE